jgi:ABC-2 type transport system permease protein
VAPVIRRILLLTRLETLLFLREPAAVFFAFAFPFLMLVFFGTAGGRGPVLAVSLAGLGAFTIAVFGPAPRFQPVAFGIAVVVTMYAMFSLGVFVGGLPVSARGNQVIGAVLFFVMFFGSGALVRRDRFPAWLSWVGEVNPLSYLIDALAAGYTGRPGPPVLPLAVVCAVTVVLNVVTGRTFDWEGRA